MQEANQRKITKRIRDLQAMVSGIVGMQRRVMSAQMSKLSARR